MSLSRRHLLAALAAGASPLAARAIDLPGRPVKIVVPFTPGGVGDVFARVAGEIMAKDLGQTVIVENKPGANQMLAAAAVGQAPPDGHMLYQATSTAILNPMLYKKLAYDPKSLKPLWIGIETPLIYVINPKVPAKTLSEFAAWARANAGKANYSSIGPGNVLHLGAEKLKQVGNFDMVHVPYAGRSADAINAVLAGDVEMMCTIAGQAVPFVQAGKLRGLAVTSAQRLPVLPDVPTAAEAGFPSLAVASWYGLYVHSATPDPVANKLRLAADKALADTAFRERFIAQGAVIAPPRSGAEVAHYVEENSRYWGEIIRAQKIELD
ncbi:tripartite tricarboxylate transporter substrate binding protein [Ramlibacter sp. G-1-2-2]|uniref:Tripartite tricarboxylate transporter substrate binding protein n=1 Tax=Ramlibacter agri TaxID=2728837 RepID=A0A848H1D5_9BURK|nr:tripartite tricarboxylate transporter substrate binding protein [Ramlibacter agri]